MHHPNRPVPVAVAVLFLVATTASAQEVTLKGTVETPQGAPLSAVTVSVYQRTTPLKDTTGRSGEYSVRIPSGDPINYIVFERAGLLPKVVEGPFSSTKDSRLHVVLVDTTRTMTLAETLSTIHSIQFLRLIASRSDVELPKSLPIPPQLKLAADSIAVSSERPPAPNPGVPRGGGGKLLPPKGGLWPMDDPFFSGLDRKK